VRRRLRVQITAGPRARARGVLHFLFPVIRERSHASPRITRRELVAGSGLYDRALNNIQPRPLRIILASTGALFAFRARAEIDSAARD